jgi:NAD(P)-dependent dehydrogenase (short-subunit alcohol dehydrogenase family)
MSADSPARPGVWLITGASSGLGLELTRASLARGATVIATARDPGSITAPLPDHTEDKALVRLALDVTDTRQIDAAVTEALERFGRIDVLVNNAGRVQLGAVEELTDADLQALFDLHVIGPARLTRSVLPGMRERGFGTIVQMSTMGAFFITPGFGAYTATKAALEGLSASLAKEVAPFGIRVMLVEPGAHRTAVFSPQRCRIAAPHPAYRDTIGAVRRAVEGMDGRQPGDPARVAEIVVDVALSDAVPLRLPLGEDAVANIRGALDEIASDLRTWEGVARSTAYGAAPVPLPSAR